MHVRNKFHVLGRSICASGNLIQRVPKGPSLRRQPCLLALVVFAAALAGGGAVWATPTLTTLVTFNGPNGALPVAGLVADADGNLYGTAENGGTSNIGTVFEISAGTRALATLVNFGPSNGQYPYAGLSADAAGNLYGTTIYGVGSGDGTVYEIDAATHSFSTLATFDVFRPNGLWPYGGVIADSAGNLYGTTFAGNGTVFKVESGTHALSVLATFSSNTGFNPRAGVVADAAGNLYGTTQGGGPGGAGTVFKIAAGTHILSTVAAFNHTNGAFPEAGVIVDAAGNLYGTTYHGGASDWGTVFEIAAGTGTVSTLATFNLGNGGSPYGSLILDAAGNLYGTTSQGGANHAGTIFEIAAGTHTLTTLASLDFIHGSNPQAGLIADASGNLYGTAMNGGANNDGTVFELTDTGFVTSTPEPAALSLIGLAGTGLLARRRRSRMA